MRRTDEAFKHELFRRYEQYKKNRRSLRILAAAPVVLSILVLGILLPNLNIQTEQPVANNPEQTTRASITSAPIASDATTAPDLTDPPEPDLPENPSPDESDLIFEADVDGNYIVVGFNDPTAETVEIPATYNGRAVIGIGKDAFQANTRLKKVIIADSVTGIDDNAFADCESLEEVILPSALKSIGESAFMFCSKLSRVDLPDGLEMIASYAFLACSELAAPTIPDSVTIIDAYAFSGCYGFEQITIPNGVKRVGQGAFSECLNLKSISFPESILKIGDEVLAQCGSLNELTIDQDNQLFYSIDNCLIERESRKLIAGCNTIPDDGSIRIIGRYAFAARTDLTEIVVPEGVTEIGEGAFSNCSSAKSMHLPTTPNWIGEDAFYACSSLSSITVESGIQTGYISVGNCLIQPYAGILVKGCNTSVIPDDGTLTSIGSGAFDHCEGLRELVIPDGVTHIGGSAFLGCDQLKAVTIPSSVTYIDIFAFSACYSLESVVFEEPSGWSADNVRLDPRDASVAAQYLTEVYDSYAWQRS